MTAFATNTSPSSVQIARFFADQEHIARTGLRDCHLYTDYTDNTDFKRNLEEIAAIGIAAIRDCFTSFAMTFPQDNLCNILLISTELHEFREIRGK